MHHSVVGLRTLVSERCLVEDSLLMGADYYETLEECALIPGCLPMGLGELGPLACGKGQGVMVCCITLIVGWYVRVKVVPGCQQAMHHGVLP